MSMADLVQWARTAQRTGLLRLTDDRGKEIRVTFSDGRIDYSSTNGSREVYGAWLLHLGLCTQTDIEHALEIQASTGALLASILVREQRITPQAALKTLEMKTIEDLCDVFLWSDGSFEFSPETKREKPSVTLNLDPIRVVMEGLRRADVWSRITSTIHPHSVFEIVDPEQTMEEIAEGDWEDVRMARRVLRLCDENRSVGDLAEQLPFGRYKIYRAISELREKKLIVPADTTAVIDREGRVRRKIDEAAAAAESGRWTEAMEMLQGLSSANPGRQDIVDELLRLTDRFREAIYEHNFTLDDVPVVTIGPDAMSHANIEPSEAFIMSRIDGYLTVRDIIRISPIAEFECLRTLKRLLSAKVIDFPNRSVRHTAQEPRLPIREAERVTSGSSSTTSNSETTGRSSLRSE